MADVPLLNPVAVSMPQTARFSTAVLAVVYELVDQNGRVIGQDTVEIDLRDKELPPSVRTQLEDVAKRLARLAKKIA